MGAGAIRTFRRTLVIIVLAATACGTDGPDATSSTEPPTTPATTTTISRPNTTTTSVPSTTTSTSTTTTLPVTTSTSTVATTTTMPDPPEAPETVELVISEPDRIRTLDPMNSGGGGQDAPLLTTVYETLAWTSPSGELLPRLATEWAISEDRRTYTFHLRQGVRFHNGADFTAEDVVYSVTRAITGGSPVVRQQARNLESVIATGDHTVVFQLREPSGAFLFDIAGPTGTGFSILTETAPAHGMDPVGTGPFRFVSHVPQSELVLEPNPDYWDPSVLPGYERLRIRILEDEPDRVAALEAGEVALVRTDTIGVAAGLAGNPLLKVLGTPASTIWLHAARSGRTSDGAVVRAAWLSVDRQGLADIAFAGEAAPWSTSHPLLAYGQGPTELAGYQRDVEAAAQILAEAGYEEGISLELLYPEDEYPDTFFDVLLGSWAAAGIGVEPVPVDRATWLARLVTADYDLTLTRHGWYANPYRYLLPRPGWQAPTEHILPELIPALADLATASDEDRPDAFRTVQLLEAEHGYPFIGVVYVRSHHAYHTGLIESADVTGSVTGDRRDLYLSLVPAGQP